MKNRKKKLLPPIGAIPEASGQTFRFLLNFWNKNTQINEQIPLDNFATSAKNFQSLRLNKRKNNLIYPYSLIFAVHIKIKKWNSN